MDWLDRKQQLLYCKLCRKFLDFANKEGSFYTINKFTIVVWSFPSLPLHSSFLRILIASRNSRYLWLLVDFEAEVKTPESARAKNRKKVHIVLFLENKVHFNPIILVNTNPRLGIYPSLHTYLWGIVVKVRVKFNFYFFIQKYTILKGYPRKFFLI